MNKHTGPHPGARRVSRRLPDATMPVCFGCGATRPAQRRVMTEAITIGAGIVILIIAFLFLSDSG